MATGYNPFSGFASRKVEERKVAAEKKANSVPTGTVSEITDWVGDDKAKAQRALDAENANSKPRKTLVEDLEKILNPESPVEAPAKAEESTSDNA